MKLTILAIAMLTAGPAMGQSITITGSGGDLTFPSEPSTYCLIHAYPVITHERQT